MGVDKTTSVNPSSFDMDEKELEDTVGSTKQESSKKSLSVQVQSTKEEVEAEQEFDEESFSKEMDLALDNVRQLGKAHQQELVDSICDTFYDLNGIEASFQDISSILARLSAVFAEEAAEDDDADSDYDEQDAFDKSQVQQDEEEDYSSDEEEEEEEPSQE